MRIQSLNVGDKRFLMHIRMDGRKEAYAFKKWMGENYPNCMCAIRSHFGHDPYMEVRGSDTTIPMMVKMVWG